MEHKIFLREAIYLAVDNVKSDGGPFGALVVNKHGEIIGRGQNKVTATNDPAAHAEVQAIREACLHMDSFQLTSCVLYTSCEPCPMCLGAIYWARLEKIYYAADQVLAAGGFDDAFIYEEINKEHQNRSIPFHSINLHEKNLPFETWEKQASRVEY